VPGSISLFTGVNMSVLQVHLSALFSLETKILSERPDGLENFSAEECGKLV